jgi:hypothetical protein
MKSASFHRAPAAALLLSLILQACNHPAQFVPPILEADPRNFSWTIDTIALPGSPATLMRSIWGASSRDVYIAGHNDLPRGTMFHYDGTSWHTVNLTAAEGGTIQGSIDLSQVTGFSGGDIFAAGGKTTSGFSSGMPAASLVIHFDGNAWSEMQVPPGGMLRGIWGLYHGEMWAAGASGTLFQFIGSTWIPATLSDTGSFTAISGVSADDVYALSSRSDAGVHDTTFRYLWHWNGGVWSIADSFPQVAGHADRFGTRSVWSLLAITYTSGQGVFKRDGSVRSSLFVVGDGGGVFHVNPADWYRYAQFADPAINYYGVWTDGREAFVVGNDGKKPTSFTGSNLSRWRRCWAPLSADSRELLPREHVHDPRTADPAFHHRNPRMVADHLADDRGIFPQRV